MTTSLGIKTKMFVISIGFGIFWVNMAYAGTDTTLVKTYDEPNGYKTRVYCDGKETVTAYFDDQDRLIDCDYQQGNMTNVAQVFQEAIVKQSSDQIIEIMDVRRLGRACKRFIRKIMRAKLDEKDTSNIKEAKLRRKLHKGVPGTSWCAISGFRPDKDNEVEDTSSNTCCKKFHSCNITIPALSYKYQHYNVYTWALPHCSCSGSFYSCLAKSKGPLAKEVGELYFNILKLRCFEIEERDLCSERDQWYRHCVKYTQAEFAVLKENSKF